MVIVLAGLILATRTVRDYHSIPHMQRSVSQQSVADPAAFVRANYVRLVSSRALLPPDGTSQSRPPSQEKRDACRAWPNGFRVVSG